MPLSALPLMASWWRSEAVFPPQHAPANYSYAPRSFRSTSNRAVRRARAERHNPTSIATLRIEVRASSWPNFLIVHSVVRFVYNTVVLEVSGPIEPTLYVSSDAKDTDVT